MTTRIGPQMSRAIQYVSTHPGCNKLAVATYLLPHAIGLNNAFAYAPVNRAIKAGLIVAKVGKGSAYSLTVRP